MELNRDLMLGMLRRGQDGNQIMAILEMLTSQMDNSREQVCEDLGIADCPENDDEISAQLAAV